MSDLRTKKDNKYIVKGRIEEIHSFLEEAEDHSDMGLKTSVHWLISARNNLHDLIKFIDDLE